MTNITGYLIDPKAATIQYVTVGGEYPLKAIYALLDCSTVDVVRIGKRHVIYCDDNGLTDGLECFTELVGHPSPLAGRLLYIGTDEDGNNASPRHSINAVADLFSVVRPVLDPVFEEINEPHVFGMRFKRFDVRLDKRRPEIIVS